MNYNQQQQAVIVKGIAQQILQMNVPSFQHIRDFCESFEITEKEKVITSDKEYFLSLLINDIRDTLISQEQSELVDWIQTRLEEFE